MKTKPVFYLLVLFCSCTGKVKQDLVSAKTAVANSNQMLAASLAGAVYDIPAGTIADHSDPTIPGSIAWYFSTYGAGNTYNLSQSAVYPIKNRLIIPVNSTLGATDSTIHPAIQPAALWGSDSIMVLMNNDGTTIRDIELNGLFMAKQIVSGNGHQVSLIHITAHRSAKVHQGHLIVFSTAKNVLIRDCLLRRAACDTEVHFPREASLIYTRKCDTVTIKNNDMAIAASAGINFTGSTNVTIAGNEISDAGRAEIPGYIADGITAYHTSTGYLYLNVWITSNRIWNCRNNGIHISGRDLHIENNKIYSCGLITDTSYHPNNIRIGDQYASTASDSTYLNCSSNVTIKNNTIDNCPGIYHNNTSIYILGPYKTGGVAVSGNTGCTSVFWNTNNTCL
ncbi:MAG: right-handed parallel beta-helix repeat-containing protein [Niabella sp.]|nr:right-handed parallel beta-helix repeat-containing protein [Niabella sp.]